MSQRWQGLIYRKGKASLPDDQPNPQFFQTMVWSGFMHDMSVVQKRGSVRGGNWAKGRE